MLNNITKILSLASLFLLISGCATLTKLEYVQPPPEEYKHKNVSTTIEFLSQGDVLFRCFERGVVVPALACSSRNLMTVPDPCLFASDEKYAEILCHEVAHVNGWPADHSNKIPKKIRPASESPEAKDLEKLS